MEEAMTQEFDSLLASIACERKGMLLVLFTVIWGLF